MSALLAGTMNWPEAAFGIAIVASTAVIVWVLHR